MSLEALSDADLMALKSGDLSRVSDAGLLALKKGRSVDVEPMPTKPRIESPVLSGAALLANPLQQLLTGVGKSVAASPVGRNLGLTGRYLVEGAASVPSLPFNIANALSSGLGGEPIFRTDEAVSGLLDKLGVPRPEGSGEMFVGDVSRGMAGMGTFGGTANLLSGAARSPVAQNIFKTLAANPLQQLLAGGGGGAGQAIARENELGPLGTAGATLAGALAAPAGYGVAKNILGHTRNLYDVFATGLFKNKASTERLAEQAATMMAGEKAARVKAALQNARTHVKGASPTLGETLAEANINRPEVFGDDLIALEKTLSRQPGYGEILRSKQAATQRALKAPIEGMAGGQTPQARQAAVAAFEKKINQITEPMREAAMKRTIKDGVDIGEITNHLDKILATPGQRGSLNQRVIGAVKDKLLEYQKLGGRERVSAEDLYSIRKQEIGDIVAQLTKDSDAATKARAGGLLNTVKGQIDDAIEASGGTGWKDYLKRYAELANKRDRMLVAEAVLEKMSTDAGRASPNQLLKVLGSGEQQLLKREVGFPGVESIEDVMSPAQAKYMRNVEKVTRAQAQAKTMASEVLGADLESLGMGEIPKLPTLLHRPMMAVNFALRTIGKDATTPIARELAKRATSPQEFAKLIQLPSSDPLGRAARGHLQRALVATQLQQRQDVPAGLLNQQSQPGSSLLNP